MLHCDICIVFLKYFFTYSTSNLTFLHYITNSLMLYLRSAYAGQLTADDKGLMLYQERPCDVD